MGTVKLIIEKLTKKFLSPQFSYDESKNELAVYLGGKHVHLYNKASDKTSDEFINELKQDRILLEKEKALRIIREDEKKEFDDLIQSFKEQRQIIKEIKPLLNEDDRNALELSFVYYKRIKRGDKTLALETENKIRRLYGERGNHIRLLYCAGYFEGIVLEKLKEFNESYSEEEIKEKFREYIDRILKFFELAIFVSHEKSISGIIDEVKLKLFKYKAPFIDLHAVGELNIEKVDKAILELEKLDEFSNMLLSIEETKSTLGKYLIYSLKPKKKK